MNKLIGCLAFTMLLLSTSFAQAHDGYHYAGLAGTQPVTDTTHAAMMMPHKPTNCSQPCHVIGWTILWDAYATGQFVEAGIGYNRNKSKRVTLWWASPQHGTMKKVGSVPYGTWVDVTLYKPLGEEYIEATWTWDEGEVVKRIKTPGWTGNMAYHPTKVEVWKPEGSHPRKVELHFEDIAQWPGDDLRWHIEGPWIPVGTFENFVVRRGDE